MIWGFFFCCVITWILEHHWRSCSTKWIRFSSFFDFANGIPGWHFVVLVEIRPYFRIGKWDNGSKLHCGYLGSSHSQLLWWGFTPTSTCLVTPSRKNDSQLAVVVIIIIIVIIIITIVFTKKRETNDNTQIQTHNQKLKKHLLHLHPNRFVSEKNRCPARRDLTNFWRTCTPAAPHLARPPQFWRSERNGSCKPRIFCIHKNLFFLWGRKKSSPYRGWKFPQLPGYFRPFTTIVGGPPCRFTSTELLQIWPKSVTTVTCLSSISY